MSKGTYIGIDNIARKIKKGYIGVNGVAHKIIKAYIGVNGVARLCWQSGYKNWVQHSINADGTIYNNGLGYKNGYRVRSGGAEGTNSGTTCTGFIPVKAGDVVRISGCDFSHSQNGNAINVSNSSFTNIGQFTMLPAHYGIFANGATYHSYSSDSVVEEKSGVWKWVVPPAASNVAYIRVSGYNTNNSTPGANLIVTINEEIEV